METERKQATDALIARLDAACILPTAPRGRSKRLPPPPHQVYQWKRQEIKHAWAVKLADPVARKQIQLDRRWNVSKSAEEGMITLLEMLLDLWLWSDLDPGWDLIFDGACRSDLIDNVRCHSYHNHNRDQKVTYWAISWSLSVTNEYEKVVYINNHARHDIVHICQAVIFDACGGCGSTLEIFALAVLNHLLAVRSDCSAKQLDVRHLFITHPTTRTHHRRIR
jgi:hypothetical protein